MLDYGGYRYLDVTVRDGIAFLVLSRPERLNACALDDHAELARILRDLARDDDVRVAAVTGAGRAFSVGGDLEMLERLIEAEGEEAERLFADARELVLAHVDLDKPVVAAVNGHAMGAGAAFALLSDYIVMERQAVIADGHIRAALAAGDGGALIWTLTVGLTKAKQYLLTGDGIDATEEERLGLVTELAEEGQSWQRATEVATRLAAGPQRAIRYTKRALNQWLRSGVATAFDYSLALELRSLHGPEAAEAIQRLRTEKRSAIPQA
jgi:enoyl-CoA hydratase